LHLDGALKLYKVESLEEEKEKERKTKTKLLQEQERV
tara:strand:+ start:742 stop:852 length:111 start_codon:yes stop_codon:yes gene_type:complete